jgi:hypothetical protein
MHDKVYDIAEDKKTVWIATQKMRLIYWIQSNNFVEKTERTSFKKNLKLKVYLSLILDFLS